MVVVARRVVRGVLRGLFGLRVWCALLFAGGVGVLGRVVCCLGVVLVVGGGVVVDGASAVVVESPPEFGSCVKVVAGEGEYSDGGCTAAGGTAKYRWENFASVGKTHFKVALKSATGTVVLETAEKTGVSCTAENGSGTYSGPRELRAVGYTFSGCTELGTGAVCASAGASAGEVWTAMLSGELGVTELSGEGAANNKLGVAFRPESGSTVASFSCGGSADVVTGAVIAEVTTDSAKAAWTEKLKASSKGVQKPEAFATSGAHQAVLSASIAGGGAVQAGLTATEAVTNEEAVEARSVVSAPPAAEPVAIVGSPRVGVALTVNTSGWRGTLPISFKYEWQRCTGSSCSAISGAVHSYYTVTEADVGHTLRLHVTAKNIAGEGQSYSAQTSSALTAGAGPFAHVLNSEHVVVGSWGSAFASSPGGQIQAAETFAHVNGDPLVTLDSGTFSISTAQKVSGLSVGVFLYTGIALEGVVGGPETPSPSVIKAETGVEFVAFAASTPETITTAGNSLALQFFTVNGNSHASTGLGIGRDEGTGLHAEYITTEGTTGMGILAGDPSSQYGGHLSGTTSSPVSITHDIVLNSGGDGIAFSGSNVVVASDWVENTVTENGNAILALSETSNAQIYSNLLRHVTVGVNLNGSSTNGKPQKETEQGFGVHNNVFSNNIVNSCRGAILYRQTRDYIYSNHIYNELGFVPSNEGLSCPSTQGNAPYNNVGLTIQDSHDNYAYSNYLDEWLGFTIWLWDTGQSPIGTKYNGIGVYYDESTQGFPIPGNEIFNGGRPIVINDQTHSNRTSGNTLIRNVAQNNTEACYYEGSTTLNGFKQNYPASCEPWGIEGGGGGTGEEEEPPEICEPITPFLEEIITRENQEIDESEREVVKELEEEGASQKEIRKVKEEFLESHWEYVECGPGGGEIVSGEPPGEE
jgi:hypothetical protein